MQLHFDVAATGPRGTEERFHDEHSLEIPAKHRLILALVGSNATSSDLDGDGKSSEGDVVTFTADVKNAGTVDLTSVQVQVARSTGLDCRQFVPTAAGTKGQVVRVLMSSVSERVRH